MNSRPGRDPRRYMKVADMIRQQIEDGRLQPEQSLPSIGALSRDLRYSRQTIAKGFQLLLDEGLIQRLPGLGYFVLDRDPD
jgi:DNA-binding GntR family transcriptional regulator